MSESEECSVSVPGKSFCITGVTKLGRDIFYALIVQAGGRWVKSVSRSLDYLVVGEEPGPSKMEKAASWGLVCISEEELAAALRRALGVDDKVSLFSVGWRLPVQNVLKPQVQRRQGARSRGAEGAGLRVCITGKLDRPRSEYERLMADAGMQYVGSVSSSLDCLVVGEAPGSKLARAQQLKVPVHSLAWLKARLGLEAEGEAGTEEEGTEV